MVPVRGHRARCAMALCACLIRTFGMGDIGKKWLDPSRLLVVGDAPPVHAWQPRTVRPNRPDAASDPPVCCARGGLDRVGDASASSGPWKDAPSCLRLINEQEHWANASVAVAWRARATHRFPTKSGLCRRTTARRVPPSHHVIATKPAAAARDLAGDPRSTTCSQAARGATPVARGQFIGASSFLTIRQIRHPLTTPNPSASPLPPSTPRRSGRLSVCQGATPRLVARHKRPRPALRSAALRCAAALLWNCVRR
jgi:hypothetical protein